MIELQQDPQVLVDLAGARMPFGKYAGRPLLHLPEAYLIWFRHKGFPAGKLGQQMAMMLEIKTNGLEPLVAKLVPED